MIRLTTEEKETIEDKLCEIFTNQPLCLTNYSPRKSMKLYTLIYTYCVKVRKLDNIVVVPLAEARREGILDKNEVIGEEVYLFLKNFIIRYLKNVYQSLTNFRGINLLEPYVKLWNNFLTSATITNDCFSYLNRFYVRNKIENGDTEFKIVKRMLINEFKEHIFFPFCYSIKLAILELINRERQYEPTDYSSLIFPTLQSYIFMDSSISKEINQQIDEVLPINSIVSSEEDGIIKNFDIYIEFFEKEFLETTKIFYSQESTEYLQKHNVSQYLAMIEKRIKEEQDRCIRYMDSRTISGLTTILNKVLIQNHVNLLKEAFDEMIVDEKHEDLSRIYKLCKDVSIAKVEFTSILEKNIVAYGRRIIGDYADVATQNHEVYVQKLLEIYNKFHSLVVSCFNRDSSFFEALDKGCQEIINENSVTVKAGNKKKCAELIARYVDSILRKNSKVPDCEMAKVLIDLTTIFKFIREKDIFLNFYLRSYAKRLINNTSIGEEYEKTFIGHLRSICGFDFTIKLEKMGKDMVMSKEISENFRQYLSNKGTNSFDFSVNILTNVNWPYKKTMPCTIPPIINSKWKEFEKYYISQYKERKLCLLMDLSKGEIQSNCFKKCYIFRCCTPQMAILMIYNDKNEATFKEIKNTLEIKDSDVKTMIAPLVDNDLLQISCKSSAGDIDENSIFTLNTKFRNKKLIIDLARISGKIESSKESISVFSDIESDRKCLLEAVIVRIMKARKELKHQQLLVEVINQLEHRFKPEVSQIKKYIDVLIEKEYLKRKESDKETYEYLA